MNYLYVLFAKCHLSAHVFYYTGNFGDNSVIYIQSGFFTKDLL